MGTGSGAIVKHKQLCLQCRCAVPRYAADYVFQDGSRIHRAGKRGGGFWIQAHDPHGLFCSMRCAAQHGIDAARHKLGMV